MTNRYTTIAKVLHWAMALLLCGLIALGFYMHDLPLSPEKLKLYSWHKWAGVTLFLLALFRLGWRFGHRPPALPESMPKLTRAAAHAVHFILYLSMLAIPVSGWLMSSAKGIQTVLFGVIPLPDLLEKSKATGDMLQTTHTGLNILLIAIVVAHVGAALKHHFFDKDEILTRMLPDHFKEPLA